MHIQSCGFCANFKWISQNVNAIERKGYNVIVKTIPNGRYGDMMAYFIPPPFKERPDFAIIRKPSVEASQLASQLIDRPTKYEHDIPELSRKNISVQETAIRHFSPIQNIVDSVNKILEPLKNPIGVHIRRGDAHSLPWIPTKYLLSILINNYPGRDVFVCSDSELAVVNMTKLLEKSGINHAAPPSLRYGIGTTCWKGIHRSNIGTAFDRANGIVTDIFCLAKCKERLSNFSNVGTVCKILNPLQPIFNVNIKNSDEICKLQQRAIWLNKKRKLGNTSINYIEELCDNCESPDEYLQELNKFKGKVKKC
jgi:hypothetical protein